MRESASATAPAGRRLGGLLAGAVRRAGVPLWLGTVAVVAAGPATAEPSPARIATPAPVEVVQELEAALTRARERFEARDAAGVLAHVSEQYRSGPLTKAGLRQQLLAIFALYDEVQARVTLDEVQLVNGTAWVYTTGEVSGRLPWLGTWMTVLVWVREPEVAWREGAAWRLIGFQ